MSVHQRKDSRWICQHRDKKTGKLKTEYFGRGPEAEAKAFERNKELGFRKYERKEQGYSAFFSDLVNSYSKAKLGVVQESTLKNFMWKMDGKILPEIGHLRAMQLTPARIDKYVSKRLRTKTRTGKPVKRTTLHRELSDIKAV